MKVWVTLILPSLAAILSLVLKVSCETPLNCQWGAYGDWSECDGCKKTQTRMRPVLVYGQYGGSPCSGEAFQTRACIPTRGCPIEAGCGDRFRCSSGQCISRSLVCNGDQDCEDNGFDEHGCEAETNVCDNDKVPPKAELTGKGFDVLKGKIRNSVINTKSFGGHCRKVFSGDHSAFFRLTQNLIKYTFQVKVQNDFSDEFYNSSWSYKKHTESIQTSNYDGNFHHVFDSELTNEKSYRLLVIKNEVEVAQFLNGAPGDLTLSEEFWKELSWLPSAYEYGAYRQLIEHYGTHFMKEGAIGGQYQALLYMDSEKMRQNGISNNNAEKCTSSSSGFLFFSVKKSECSKLVEALRTAEGYKHNKVNVKTLITGGSAGFTSGLNLMDLNNPSANSELYSKWAGSVKQNPSIIKQKLMPLFELVKEVPCAGVKKHNMARAIEEYLNERHACRCRPCQNNGIPIVIGTECKCTCKPDTFGHACEHGTLLQEQPGVRDGSWSCWSLWSSCSQGQRSRTRLCNNPYPSVGGKHCIGEAREDEKCGDEELQYLRLMEPHCFDTTFDTEKSCKHPPSLQNGFVQDPKALYPVGTKIVYSCKEGYFIIGDPVTECGEDLSWTLHPVECKSTVCEPPDFLSDVKSNPRKPTYQIGDKISVSCPPGKQLAGAAEIMCDSSLNWSPDITQIKCNAVIETTKAPVLQCKSWEKLENSRCVCKMPYDCKSSLEVCATNAKTGRTDMLSVCKVQALRCLGRVYNLAENTACGPPSPSKPCPGCQLWEKCDEHANTCVCREDGECVEKGAHICVHTAGSTDDETMTECEAGHRRCRGVEVTVVSTQPCEF
ncbi:complement component C7 [Amia ocellicauda]|uniref:complement component C7 n=1 Tax=Amia ocellicauda TaxID=2972642 RepID=UPI003463FD05